MKPVVIGSRGSRLALIQAEMVAGKLKDIRPGLEISIKRITTAGDRDRLTHLDRIGVNVFVKELEEALLDGRIDLAVHSLKDVPTEMPQGLGIVAVTKREDPRDVLVARAKLDALPTGASIGTGSLRRSIQLSRLHPDIEACSIRGNVDTRLGKVSSGELDGVILAAAALSRMGWLDKVTQYLPPDDFLPAAGQGALGLETRLDDMEIIGLATSINHPSTWRCVTAERAFLRELGGGCRAPIAVLGTIEGERLALDGLAASPLDKKMLRYKVEGEAAAPEEAGIRLAARMLAMGASRFIAEAKLNEIR